MRPSREIASAASDANLPERRLMAAIMWNAYHSLEGMDKPALASATDATNDALRWFRSEEDDYVFSFLHICGRLSIDPTVVLKRIAALTDPDEAPAPHAELA